MLTTGSPNTSLRDMSITTTLTGATFSIRFMSSATSIDVASNLFLLLKSTSIESDSVRALICEPCRDR